MWNCGLDLRWAFAGDGPLSDEWPMLALVCAHSGRGVGLAGVGICGSKVSIKVDVSSRTDLARDVARVAVRHAAGSGIRLSSRSDMVPVRYEHCHNRYHFHLTAQRGWQSLRSPGRGPARI